MFKKLFEPTKYEQWWDSLSPHTKTWLSNQPIWYDKDVAKFVTVAVIVGYLLGKLI